MRLKTTMAAAQNSRILNAHGITLEVPKGELSLEQIKENDTELPANTMYHAAIQSFEDQLLDEARVEQFLQTLPDIDRQIIMLRMQNNTLAEIAQKLNFANAGTVSKHLAKIRKQLEIYRKK